MVLGAAGWGDFVGNGQNAVSRVLYSLSSAANSLSSGRTLRIIKGYF